MPQPKVPPPQRTRPGGKLHPLIRIPLSIKEGQLLSNPPAAAFVKISEGNGDRQDLWKLWFRALTTEKLIEKYYSPEILAEIQPITKMLEDWYFRHVKEALTQFTFTPEQLGDTRVMLDLAEQVQKETNRHYQLVVYITVQKHCMDKANAAAKSYLQENRKQHETVSRLG